MAGEWAIPVWPSPPQVGITDYADDDEAIVAGLQEVLRHLKYIGTDSRYSAGVDRAGYERRIVRVERMLDERGAPHA